MQEKDKVGIRYRLLSRTAFILGGGFELIIENN